MDTGLNPDATPYVPRKGPSTPDPWGTPPRTPRTPFNPGSRSGQKALTIAEANRASTAKNAREISQIKKQWAKTRLDLRRGTAFRQSPARYPAGPHGYASRY